MMGPQNPPLLSTSKAQQDPKVSKISGLEKPKPDARTLNSTHRPHSSSFLGFICRVLYFPNRNYYESLWVGRSREVFAHASYAACQLWVSSSPWDCRVCEQATRVMSKVTIK